MRARCARTEGVGTRRAAREAYSSPSSLARRARWRSHQARLLSCTLAAAAQLLSVMDDAVDRGDYDDETEVAKTQPPLSEFQTSKDGPV